MKSDFKTLFLLTLFTGIRLYLIWTLPLTGDEAYYWQWSKHLALGYHDHPPLVGWLIWIASFLGQSAFWVRFPSIVLAFFSGLFFYLFTQNITGSKKNAFYAVCLFLFIPVLSISALAIFPDAPLIFSWVFFLWAAWKWRENEKHWFWMGLALGIAGLSKLMGFFLLPSFFFFILISKSERSLLKRKSFWKSLLLAFFLISPLFFWNYQHHFETFTYQVHQRLERNLLFSPSAFLNYASLQFAALSPLIFILVLATTWMLIKDSFKGDLESRFLLTMALPIHVTFLFFSFFIRVGLHWALPGYLSILAAVPSWVQRMESHGKKWIRSFFIFSLAMSLAMVIFFFTVLKWPEFLVPRISLLGLHHQEVNHGKIITSQSMTEILCYEALGKRVASELQGIQGSSPQKPFAFTDSYSLSSVISFYAKTDAKTLLFTSIGGDYDRWNRFQDYQGHDALYVDTQPIGSRPDIDAVLHAAFKTIIPLAPLQVTRGPLQTGTFYFALCVDLTNPSALRPSRPW